MCPDKELLSAFFDGEVEAKFYTQIEEHIKSCSSCSEYIAKLEKMSAFLKSDSVVGVPDIKQLIERAEKFDKSVADDNTSVEFPVFYKKMFKYSAVAAVMIAVAVSVILPGVLSDRDLSSAETVAEQESEIENSSDSVLADNQPEELDEENDEQLPELLEPAGNSDLIKPVDN